VVFGGASTISAYVTDVSSGVITLNNMTINKTGGSGVYTADDRIVVTGALQLTDGIIGSGTVEAQAGVTLASAFDGGGGSLMFSGAATRFTRTTEA